MEEKECNTYMNEPEYNRYIKNIYYYKRVQTLIKMVKIRNNMHQKPKIIHKFKNLQAEENEDC